MPLVMSVNKLDALDAYKVGLRKPTVDMPLARRYELTSDTKYKGSR